MELRDYLRVLRRDWLLIAVVTLLTAGLSLGYTFTSSAAPTYQATTRLFVSGWPSSDSDFNGLERLSTTRVLSYVEVAHSDALARRVVKRLGLSESPRDLAAKVSASTLSNTVILDISVFDPSPDRAQLLANAVAKELGRFGTELETPPGEPRSNVKVTIIDDAAKPTSPADAPQHDRNVALGLMLGFLLGFGIAVVRESTRSKGDTA